tara:strand:+ start:945 stop:1415 length:471 start_codon:yes stop_codon:yes gene_type:complete
VKKLPLFSLALVAAIPALWFIWIVVGGPMWEGNYGTFQVQVFKNKAVLVMLLLTLIVCALLAFTPVLALIFGGGSESLEPALADGGGTAVEVDPETDEAVDDDPFEGDEGDEDDEDDDPFAEDDEESDGELEIEGLDEDDIFDEDDEDDGFAFDDE